MKILRGLAALAVVAALSATPLLAQDDQGRIGGTVRDQSSSFAAGTAVKVKIER